MKLVFIALLLSIISKHLECLKELSQECSEIYQSQLEVLAKGHLSNNNLSKQFIYSGKTLNSLGSYDKCISNQNNLYYLVNLDGIGIYCSIGLCVPKQCTIEDFEYFINTSTAQFINKIQSLIPSEFNTNIRISVSNPVKYIDNLFQIDFWLILALGYFSILIILCLLGTIISCKQKYLNQFQNQEKTQISWMLVNNYQIDQEIQHGLTNNFQDFILCFSFIDNAKQLCQQDKANRDSNLNVFDGIRILSIMWIIFGHSYLSNLFFCQNLLEFEMITKDRNMLLVYAAFFGVDVFFLLSGFFLAIIFFKKIHQNTQNEIILYLKLIIHRVIRIWPSYITTLLFYWKIFPLLGNGPLWPKYVETIKQCQDSIWQNILFIYNYYISSNEHTSCFQWGWYLAIDFQMLMVVLMLLLIYKKSQKMGLLLITLTLLSSIVYTCIYAYIHNFKMLINLHQSQQYFQNIYFQPWTRLPPYLIGVIFGMTYTNQFFVKFKSLLIIQLQSRLLSRLSFYLFGLSLILLITFLPQPILTIPNYYGKLMNSFYVGTSRCIFVVGVAIILIPAILGQGQFLRFILANKVTYILSKLTFNVYLIHLIIYSYKVGNARQSNYISHFDMRIDSLCNGVSSFLLAFILSASVEISFTNIEQKFLRKRLNNQQQHFQQENESLPQ